MKTLYIPVLTITLAFLLQGCMTTPFSYGMSNISGMASDVRDGYVAPPPTDASNTDTPQASEPTEPIVPQEAETEAVPMAPQEAYMQNAELLAPKLSVFSGTPMTLFEETKVEATLDEVEITDTSIEGIPTEAQEAVSDEPIQTEGETAPNPHNVTIEGPVEAFTKEDRQRSATVMGTEMPDWFIYIATVLILSTLIAMCYIAKQRKEAHWYRRGMRE